MPKNGTNGDWVHPTPVTAWQLIAGVIAVMVTMAMALWTIISTESANNKVISDDLHNNYTTSREHRDFVERFNRELYRIDNLGNEALPRREYEAWKKERDVVINGLRKDIERLIENRVTKREFDGVVLERGKTIDALKREIETMRETEEKRHLAITDQLGKLHNSIGRTENHTVPK